MSIARYARLLVAPNVAAVLTVGLLATAVEAQDSLTKRVDSTRALRGLVPVTVTGKRDDLTGIATTASEGRVGASDLRLRPILREGELLEVVPGFIATQHSGDGKANQYFVRGFNLDHGTDFRTSLDGVPINSPTHAHGHGYTDLSFLIPEFVDHVEYKLGVSHAAIGDFGSAGAADLRLRTRLAAPVATLEGGGFGQARLVLGASRTFAGGTLLMGGEARRYDGPWERAQRLAKRSGLARWTRGRDDSQLSITAMSYANSWESSDQIPLRLVEAGTLSRFGQIDPTLGGASERHSLSAVWQHQRARWSTGGTLYAVRSALDLFSNFTYALDDEIDGDQFHQRERRTTVGGEAWGRRQFADRHTVTAGAQLRGDAVDPIGLYRTQRRARLATVREDAVRQGSLGLWTDVESRWHPMLRTTIGVRADGYQFNVESDRVGNGGRRAAWLASPKWSVAFAPTAAMEWYLSGGRGFHSNDARGTTITVDPVSGAPAEQVSPLVQSHGEELGLRVALGSWRLTAALWRLRLDSELLFIGDGGATEPVDGSRRSGATVSGFWRPDDQWSFDADVSLARARFDGVNPANAFIPGALERVAAGGITWRGNSAGPFAALRLRHFGAYPLIEDNSVRAEPSTLVNLNAGWQFAQWRVQMAVLNVADARVRDIQYFYASRVSGEPSGGVDDIHFHPVEPRQIRITLRRGW